MDALCTTPSRSECLLLLVSPAMIQGVYTGERTHDGTAQGHGKLVFPDGGVYTGQFQDNTPNGSGTFQDSRCRSQGLFVKGKQHGLGSYTRLATGAVYEGEFNEGEYQGRGVLQVSTGKYDGQFVAGVMHGHGTFVWATRFQAVGNQALTTTTVRAAEDQTVHNSSGDNDDSHSACSKPSFPDSAPRHDQGRVQSSSGTFKRQQYEGEWVRGQRSGRGCFTLPGFGPRGGGHYNGTFDGGGVLNERLPFTFTDSRNWITASQYRPPQDLVHLIVKRAACL